MLCQFIFKNFKSYRDETVFDLQATSIQEFSDSLLRSEKDNKAFLPVSAIYGPNAGGKSGILEALNSLVSHVVYPIEYMNKRTNSRISMRLMEVLPFAFDESSCNAPTEYTVFFQEDAYEFRYTLALLGNEVFSESLYKKNIGAKNPAKIFERESNVITLGTSLNKKTVNTEVNSQLPYLSFLAINYNFKLISLAVKWFSKCVFVNYANPLANSTIQLIPSEKETLIKMLQEIDIPISNYEVEYQKNEKSGANEVDSVYIVRRINNQDYKLDIVHESNGTLKLFGLLPHIIVSLREGRLLIVDELDANLHPKLLRYIIKLFTDSTVNRNNAQLLFTSHDITTMKNDVFRRDEIWFAAKDETGASEIYSLYEIRNEDSSHVKSSAPFDKQYLEGRYGADPYLSEMVSLRWEG